MGRSLDTDWAYYVKQAEKDRKEAAVIRSSGPNPINDGIIAVLETRAAQWQMLADEITRYKTGELV